MHLKGSITITMFQLRPRAPRQPAQGAQTGPPLLAWVPPGTGGISPALRSGVRGGAGPQTPQHSPGAGPALQGGGSSPPPQHHLGRTWPVCLATVSWGDSSLPVTSWEISRIKFARFNIITNMQQTDIHFEIHKSMFSINTSKHCMGHVYILKLHFKKFISVYYL